MLTPEQQEAVVSELATRPGHEMVRVHLHGLLVDGLDADSRDIDFELPVPEVHGRIDALLGRTVFELKSDLRRERNDAEEGLTRYLTDRERQTGEKYVGIATDGADFIAFFLRHDRVVEVASHHADPETPRELLAWLQATVAIGEGLQPDPETVTREFGRESLAARRALDGLSTLWDEAGQTPDARLKRELWGRLLSVAYGAEVGDDALFLQHTYLVVVAKAVAWTAMIEAPPESATDLLHGTAFTDLGIGGQSEPDFFDWVLSSEDGADLVMRIGRQVSRFRLRDIRVDILKALYESLIDPETRRDLGEYYTPDWLAARMVESVVDRPLEQRVMDPACGSGTFLFHAVRAVLASADAAGLAPTEAVRFAAGNIAGIDIHPVAVIFARVTYLLALMPALLRERPGSVALPVYLGDTLQWNRVQPGEEGDHPDMFANAGTLEIFVPAVDLAEPMPRRLEEAMLSFPAAIAADPGLFDEVLGNMIELGAREEPAANFDAWMARRDSIAAEDRNALSETYETMRRLQTEGRNHIWGYVARNLARPVWLSSEGQKAHVVIGNPPWVAYRHMRGEFQERYREEATATRVWWTGRGTSGNDLSAYFFFRSAQLYMRRRGFIALVMPAAAMSRRAYAPFRTGEVGRLGNVSFRVQFTAAWRFGPEVWPLFPVPSCVLFAQRHEGDVTAPLPEGVCEFAGTLPRRDADLLEADAALAETAAPWPSPAAELEASPYRRDFRQGAILVPRRLVLVEPVQAAGPLPPNPEIPLVRGRVGNQDKRPWRDLEPPRGTVEREFVQPALLGECIAPYRILRSLRAVIPWDSERNELMDAHAAAARGFPRLSQWLDRTQQMWNENGRGRRSLADQLDFYSQLSVQFPVAPMRVVYTKAGSNLAAAVVQDDVTVIDHKLYWAAMTNLEEVRYLCAILNSEAVRARVEEYQSQGQWGPRDFDKYVFNLPIPRFNDTDELHCRLAAAAELAERVANGVRVEEGEYFIRSRQNIRTALADRGIAAHVDHLTMTLLDDAC